MDDATFEDAAQKVAPAGMSVKIDPARGGNRRSYWAAGNQGWLQWMQFNANELGGTLKINGNEAAVTKTGSSDRVGGQQLGTVQCDCAEVDGNVINWDISPLYNRPIFQSYTTSTFDPAAVAWSAVDNALARFGAGAGIASLNNKFRKADATQAQEKSDANAAQAINSHGGGTITIIGEPAAVTRGIPSITGARPQIDGQYLIDKVEHILSREGSGFITTLQLISLGVVSGGDEQSQE